MIRSLVDPTLAAFIVCGTLQFVLLILCYPTEIGPDLSIVLPEGHPSSGPLSNIGSPRDAATLGEIGSVFPAIHVLPPQEVFCFQCPAST